MKVMIILIIFAILRFAISQNIFNLTNRILQNLETVNIVIFLVHQFESSVICSSLH